MARKRQGFTIRQPIPGGVRYVRFTCDGRTVERSTGTSDPEEAAREARRIYADAIAREKPRVRKRVRQGAVDLEEVVAGWLTSLATTHDPGTVKTWELYVDAHFEPFFGALHNFTTAQAELYMRERLGKVLADTVRREHTALRAFAGWAHANGFLPEPMIVPHVPRRAIGKPHSKRRRAKAIELSEEETRRLIALLPAWSTSKRVKRFPIRARFEVAYETGLRPELLNSLMAPLHYRKGQETIRITPDLDKGRWARDVPLSDAARRALDKVVPKSGLIFGRHDYREHLRAAAKAVLPPDRAERFNGAHLRSARVTHLLEQPNANLPGVQFLVGHRSTATTARYVRPSARAAREVLGILGVPRNSGMGKSAKERT